MEPYELKNSGCWYYTTSCFNLSEHDGRCIKYVGFHTHTRTYKKAEAANNKAVIVSDEKVGIVMGDEAIEEEDRADELDVEDEKCSGKIKERMERIYDLYGQLDMNGSKQGNRMVEQFVRILREKELELYTLEEMVRPYEDFEKRFSLEIENRVEKNGSKKIK